MIRNLPHSSMAATSPVWTHPSSSFASLVLSGSAVNGKLSASLTLGQYRQLTLMVPRESVTTPNQQLAPGERFVHHTVPHAWHIYELSFVAGWRNPDTTGAGWIIRSQTQARCARLGCSVTLDDGTRENDTQEVEHLGIQWGRTRGDELEFPTEKLANLGFPTLVPKHKD